MCVCVCVCIRVCIDPISTETGSSLKRHPTHPSWAVLVRFTFNPTWSRFSTMAIDPTCHPANGCFKVSPFRPASAKLSSTPRQLLLSTTSQYLFPRLALFSVLKLSLPRRCRIPINLHKIQSTLHQPRWVPVALSLLPVKGLMRTRLTDNSMLEKLLATPPLRPFLLVERERLYLMRTS